MPSRPLTVDSLLYVDLGDMTVDAFLGLLHNVFLTSRLSRRPYFNRHISTDASVPTNYKSTLSIFNFISVPHILFFYNYFYVSKSELLPLSRLRNHRPIFLGLLETDSGKWTDTEAIEESVNEGHPGGPTGLRRASGILLTVNSTTVLVTTLIEVAAAAAAVEAEGIMSTMAEGGTIRTAAAEGRSIMPPAVVVDSREAGDIIPTVAAMDRLIILLAAAAAAANLGAPRSGMELVVPLDVASIFLQEVGIDGVVGSRPMSGEDLLVSKCLFIF